MTFVEFLQKFKKPIIITSGSLLALAGVLYFMPVEEQQKNNQQKENNSKEEQSIEELRNSQRFQRDGKPLSPEEEQQKIDAIAQTLQLKRALQSDIKLEYNDNGLLSLNSIKVIQHRSVMIGLKKLMSVHEELIKIRQSKYDDLLLFFQLTNKLYEFYFQTLNSSLLTVVTLLEVNEELFTKSKQYYEQTQQLRPNYLRDITWHFMAEELSKKQMTIDEYANYLQIQIDNIPEQLELINKDEKLKAIDPKAKKLFINGRVDDYAFQKTGFSDCDAIKALRENSKDERIAKLLQQRTETLGNCC
ncbi:hypothetical protein PPERSA_06870 [Pseudocohnilembus persalinus]|uniref:Uncharacterized protein n=1 Tax=Pseudocohnilembus persalinus TaxID=266149 RepID=A0A0V0QSN3_PSEPJ|nr:hypothetical protein PPERSA_06870 [Pseudocohnilembus persalinus]|eukprot:KRX05236.1 hypothetical protein PPERSA_06870 [Pseudocohnilembus persalinus]